METLPVSEEKEVETLSEVSKESIEDPLIGLTEEDLLIDLIKRITGITHLETNLLRGTLLEVADS